MTDLNPLDLLKEELESDDVGSRVNAIHKLRIVATLLGPDGCKNTLLPFLDCINIASLSSRSKGGRRSFVCNCRATRSDCVIMNIYTALCSETSKCHWFHCCKLCRGRTRQSSEIWQLNLWSASWQMFQIQT